MDSEECRRYHLETLSKKETRENISYGLKKYRESNPFSLEHRKKLSESAKGNHNFGTGDTRSVGCFSIDENGQRKEFHSYKEGGIWWYENYKPFGNKYVQVTLQRKIVKSINEKIKIQGIQ